MVVPVALEITYLWTQIINIHQLKTNVLLVDDCLGQKVGKIRYHYLTYFLTYYTIVHRSKTDTNYNLIFFLN